MYTISTTSTSPSRKRRVAAAPTFACVLVRGTLGEAVERGVDAVLPVAEVALGLPPDEDERVVDPACGLLLDRVLGGADHRRVVRARQPAVGGDDDVADLADVGSGCEQQAVVRPSAGGEVVHDLGDRLAVRLRGRDVRLRPRDPARRDQLLRARDLLRRLDALDPSPENPLPTASHRLCARSLRLGIPGRGRSLAGERSTRSARSCRVRRTRFMTRATESYSVGVEGSLAAAARRRMRRRPRRTRARRRSRRGTRAPRPRACRLRGCARSRGSRRADRSTGP